MAGRIRSTSSEEPRRAAPSPLTSQGCFFQADYTLKFCGLGKHELAPAPVSPITATRRPGPWGGLRERRAFSAHWAHLGFCSLVAASPSAHLKQGRVNPPGATAGWTILSVGGHEAHTLQGSRRAPAGRAPRGAHPSNGPQVGFTFPLSLPTLKPTTQDVSQNKHPRACPRLRLCFGRDRLDNQALPSVTGTAQQAVRDTGTRNAQSPAHCCGMSCPQHQRLLPCVVLAEEVGENLP